LFSKGKRQTISRKLSGEGIKFQETANPSASKQVYNTPHANYTINITVAGEEGG